MKFSAKFSLLINRCQCTKSLCHASEEILQMMFDFSSTGTLVLYCCSCELTQCLSHREGAYTMKLV